MKKIKEKGFTLIELIAVLVIMAILALIVTPLVMNIIRKSRISADKRSVDAYGRSIELAIAGYLLDNGKFPTEVSQLTIEYSGNKVECETTQINSDSSVYLSNCKVNNREVANYIYGKKEVVPTYQSYSIGDRVRYNNLNYRVIKDSGENEESVILLKEDALIVLEVNQYGGVGTDNNHVNMYSCREGSACYQKAQGNGVGKGLMAYYTSETCGWINNAWVGTGCKNDYASSEIKYVVDAWKTAEAPAATEARLISFEDLTENLGFELQQVNATMQGYKYTEDTPDWVYNNNYYYWTMSKYNDSTEDVFVVSSDGVLVGRDVYDHNQYGGYVVRPVIVLPKSAL